MSGTQTQNPPQNPINPDMPDAVREAARRADELQRAAIAAKQSPPNGSAPEGQAGDAGAGEGSQPPSTSQGQDTPPPAEPPKTDPKPSTEAPKPEKVELPPDIAAELDRLRQGERTWKGRTDAERTRAQEAERKLAEMEANAARAAEEAAFKVPEIKDEETETYGRDLTDFIQRVAKAATAPIIKAAINSLRHDLTSTTSRFEESAQEVKKTGEELAQERFFGEVTRFVPNWQEVDVDPQFHAWLDTPDELLGTTRRAGLNEAAKERNATRAAAFFRAYLSQQNAPGTPVSSAPATPPAQQAAGTPKVKLEDLAAPGKGKSGGKDAPGDSTSDDDWTMTEIRAFYADVSMGKFVGRESEQRNYEMSIAKAQREGRIRS